MRNRKLLAAGALGSAMLIASAAAVADTLELKNGTVASGTYAGGTATSVRFETAQGVQVYQTGDILALTFTGGAAAGTPAAAAAPAAAVAPAAPAATAAPAAAAPANITIPAGTPLVVRMMDGISSKNKSGTKFTTTLDADLMVNGAVALKAGTKIYGELTSSKQARRAVGKSEIDIRLTEIASGGGNGSILIATSNFQEAGKGSGGKTVKGAAVGAGVGAIAGGGEGAAKGAAIGAGVSMIKKGDEVTIPPNALLEFDLTREITVPAGS